MGKAILKIDGNDVRGESFPQSDVQARVFNRDFINENVFPVGRDEMPPILVLGAESVEKQKKIESLEERRTVAQMELESAQRGEQTAEKEYDNFCRDRARVIKDTLRASGDSPYNNYDKSNFKTDAMKLVKSGDSKSHRLTDTERDSDCSPSIARIGNKKCPKLSMPFRILEQS